jgi:antitoxin ChpS
MNEAMIMADIAYEIMLKTGIRIEALPLWESEWEHPETFNNPGLIENIRREGIRL